MFRYKFYGILWLLCILALLAGACTKLEPTPTDGLVDTTWILESYGEQGNLQSVIEGTKITAIFDSAEGRVHGSAGCNSYFGDYQISSNKLSIPMMAHTEMGCLEPEGIMEQEERYLKTLQSTESYQIQGGKLQINCGGQILIYIAE